MIQTEFGYNPKGELLIKVNPYFMGLKLYNLLNTTQYKKNNFHDLKYG